MKPGPLDAQSKNVTGPTNVHIRGSCDKASAGVKTKPKQGEKSKKKKAEERVQTVSGICYYVKWWRNMPQQNHPFFSDVLHPKVGPWQLRKKLRPSGLLRFVPRAEADGWSAAIAATAVPGQRSTGFCISSQHAQGMTLFGGFF
jgi:hypothetical protein